MNISLQHYFRLTKPSIMLLVLTAGATGIIMEGSLLRDPVRFALFMLGLFLTGGCANSLNQYFERDIDARMSRTAGRRPLPLKSITAAQALSFSLIIGTVGVLLLWLAFNILTAFLALSTILFYGLVYTLWLKPTTSQNIVIGGLAGAMAPVGAWTAATGEMALTPWLVFFIIFFWTPPHFWALAIRFKDDYRKAGLPMMPLVRGDDATLKQIFIYTIILIPVSLLPGLVNAGVIYLLTAVVMGGVFLYKTYMAKKYKDIPRVWGVFKFSIIYLFTIFAALVLDGII